MASWLRVHRRRRCSHQDLGVGISSAFAGLAGGLYALAHPVVTLEPFNLHMSVEFIAIVVLGGVGTTFGTVSEPLHFFFFIHSRASSGASYRFRKHSPRSIEQPCSFIQSSVSFS